MFWLGGVDDFASDEVKSLASTEQMNEAVAIIKGLFIDVANRQKNETIGFTVWRDGLCHNVNDPAWDRIGRHLELSTLLYDSEETLQALQYRGNQDGFRVITKCRGLRSYVIVFTPPTE
jgi:hypothetical protein